MRKAGLVVWEAHQIGRAHGQAGRHDRRDRRRDRRRCSKNATPTPLFQGVPGVVPFPAVTCISVNEEVVHGIPGPRRAGGGDVVSIDTGCRLDGWCGDSAITHPVGKVDPQDAEAAGSDQRRVGSGHRDDGGTSGFGAKWRPRWRPTSSDAGFSVVENFVGHGIGREMHEDPQVPNFVSKQSAAQRRFRASSGAGDRGRADGQHGDQEGQRDAGPLDAGHARRPAECPFRAHDCHDRERAGGPDGRAGLAAPGGFGRLQ